jgi:hypothetical protein
MDDVAIRPFRRTGGVPACWDRVQGLGRRPRRANLCFGYPGAAATWTPIDEDLDAPPARYIMRFDVPDGFSATATGVPTEEENSGDVVWDTGIEVFGATFAVADFETSMVNWDVPVEVSTKSGEGSAERLEQKVPEHLTFLESLFSPFPYERLGISVVDGDIRGVNYSTPMRIVLTTTASDTLLVHELAHQWATPSPTTTRDPTGCLKGSPATPKHCGRVTER